MVYGLGCVVACDTAFYLKYSIIGVQPTVTIFCLCNMKNIMV